MNESPHTIPHYDLVDTHAHIMVSEFDEDREAVIDRAFEAGVSRIVAIGMDLATSLDAIALAEKYNNIYATVGIHPAEVCDAKDADLCSIRHHRYHKRPRWVYERDDQWRRVVSITGSAWCSILFDWKPY